MTTLIFYYLVFVSISFIAIDKLKITNIFSRSKIKILYNLGRCAFCVDFWVAVFTVVVLGAILGYTKTDFILPFVIAGASLTGKKILNA